jgi:hypothetical protein
MLKKRLDKPNPIRAGGSPADGKYPPAKPGALGREPLEAVGLVADAAR